MNEVMTVKDLIAEGIVGLGLYMGDGNFDPAHDGYHLRGKINSYEIVNDQLRIKLTGSEILYNSTHGSDDWIPHDDGNIIVIGNLDFDQEVTWIANKIYLREQKPLSQRKRKIDWTFIYLET